MVPSLSKLAKPDEKPEKPGRPFPRASRSVPESHISSLPIQLSKELQSVQSFKDLRLFCKEKLTWNCFKENEFEQLLRIRNAMFNRVYQPEDFFDTWDWHLITMSIDQFIKLYAFTDFMYTQSGSATKWAAKNSIETAIWSCCFCGKPNSASTTTEHNVSTTSDTSQDSGEPPRKKRARSQRKDKLMCPAQIKVYVNFMERIVTIEQSVKNHNHTMVSHYQKSMSLILKLYCRHLAQEGLEGREIKQRMIQHFAQFGLTGAEQASSCAIHNAVRLFKLSELTKIELTDPTYNKELSEMLVSFPPAGTSIW